MMLVQEWVIQVMMRVMIEHDTRNEYWMPGHHEDGVGIKFMMLIS